MYIGRLISLGGKTEYRETGSLQAVLFFEFVVVGNESFLDMGGSCVMGHFLVDSPYKVVLVLEVRTARSTCKYT